MKKYLYTLILLGACTLQPYPEAPTAMDFNTPENQALMNEYIQAVDINDLGYITQKYDSGASSNVYTFTKINKHTTDGSLSLDLNGQFLDLKLYSLKKVNNADYGDTEFRAVYQNGRKFAPFVYRTVKGTNNYVPNPSGPSDATYSEGKVFAMVSFPHYTVGDNWDFSQNDLMYSQQGFNPDMNALVGVWGDYTYELTSAYTSDQNGKKDLDTDEFTISQPDDFTEEFPGGSSNKGFGIKVVYKGNTKYVTLNKKYPPQKLINGSIYIGEGSNQENIYLQFDSSKK